MAMPILGMKLGKRLLDLWGLHDQKVRSIAFRCDIDGLVTVQIERLILEDEAEALLDALAEYHLVPVEDVRHAT